MAAAIRFTATVNDSRLRAKIEQMSRATGRTVKDETRTVMKGMVRYVIDHTPPSSKKAHGLAARASGEVSIVKDMRKLFVPVTLKNKRPEKYPNPHEQHHQAFVEAAGRKITIPTVRFHVEWAKLSSLKNLLRHNVGLMASGWSKGAAQLGVSVPAWVARHSGAARGSDLLITESKNKISMKIVNHFPATAQALADQTQRLVASAKKAAIGRLTRQLPYILKRNLRTGI